MTESQIPPDTPAADGSHAGALLRAARERQGMHIAALAAAIKVPAAKLEALEAGRYDELPDATFARALANTLCRVLKIDPAPVLALLPGTPDTGTGLARVDSGLNTPFRDRSGRADPAEWTPWRRPVLWLVALLLLSAAAFVLVPSAPSLPLPLPVVDIGTTPVIIAEPPAVLPDAASAPASDAAMPGAAASDPTALMAATTAVAATIAAAVAPASAAVAAAGESLLLRAKQATWVLVVDADQQTLLSRVMTAGETLSFIAKPPLRLRIGNVQGIELQFRGQPVNLAAASQNNIANLSLP